jgi:hypothetical protein
MTDQQFQRLMEYLDRNTASNERLADSMEALQVSNALLLNLITEDVEKGIPLGTATSDGEPSLHTMDTPAD